jgi:hypothetical protein
VFFLQVTGQNINSEIERKGLTAPRTMLLIYHS